MKEVLKTGLLILSIMLVLVRCAETDPSGADPYVFQGMDDGDYHQGKFEYKIEEIEVINNDPFKARYKYYIEGVAFDRPIVSTNGNVKGYLPISLYDSSWTQLEYTFSVCVKYNSEDFCAKTDKQWDHYIMYDRSFDRAGITYYEYYVEVVMSAQDSEESLSKIY